MQEQKNNFSTYPKRRLARIIALQILYATETGDASIDEARKRCGLFEGSITPEDIDPEEPHKFISFLFSRKRQKDKFTTALLDTYRNNHKTIDNILRQVIQRWQLERLSVIDRNILRLGVTELLYFDEIPPKVTINEYIEVAKLFGDRESASFVNGILDRVAREFATKSISP